MKPPPRRRPRGLLSAALAVGCLVGPAFGGLSLAGPLLAEEWRQLRGEASGHAFETGLPLEWGEDRNVAWKVAVPGRGWSSPVVAEGKVWLTTALEDELSLRLLGFDAASGETLHDVEVFRPESWQRGHAENSYASPTPVLEAGRIYVHFGTYGVSALSTADASVLWRRDDLDQDHEVGPGSSPILHGDLLVTNRDAMDSQLVVARTKDTGEIVWRAERYMPEGRKPPHRKAFSTPVVIHHLGRAQLISTGAAHTSAYDPATGEEIWRVRHEGYSNVPAPVVGLGTAFVTTGYMKPELLAIRLGGEGDVTDSHVRWRYHWQVPANPTPLLVGGRLYMVSDRGIASWVDVKTGEDVWRQRLGGSYYASPLVSFGRIYNWDVQGRSVVVAARDRFEELAVNQLDGSIRTTPAIADGAIFIRTDAHLYRIEDLAPPPP
ncbi:MAG: PQQ-binding-like beta-propeller repeat protein [Acidobacteriota bacterium]